MKFFIAVLLLMGTSVSGIKYAESEGPTKVDFGENDDDVLPRSDTEKDGWSNPLSWTDDATDDDTVITMVDGTLISSTYLKQLIAARNKMKHHKSPSPPGQVRAPNIRRR